MQQSVQMAQGPSMAANQPAMQPSSSHLQKSVKKAKDNNEDEREKANIVIQLIGQLKDPSKKDEAFKELNDKRDLTQDLAPVLWHSIGTVAILLQEVISIYPYLTPPTLS